MKNKLVVYLIFSVLTITISSCTEEEIAVITEVIKEEAFIESPVDSLLLGEWINIYTPSGFTLLEDGTVTYLRVDQIDGKVVADTRFIDKIKATKGRFEHLINNNCFQNICNDTTFYLVNDTLSIPIGLGLNCGTQKFVKKNEGILEEKKRRESFVNAAFEINDHVGKTNVDFKASDAFAFIDGYIYNNITVLNAFDQLDFPCNLGVTDYSSLYLFVSQEIESIGEYPLEDAHMKAAFNEIPNTYYLSYTNTNFVGGKMSITKYEVLEDKILLEGSFEADFRSTFQDVTYDSYIRDSTFKVYLSKYY